jgi:hypothetical protein
MKQSPYTVMLLWLILGSCQAPTTPQDEDQVSLVIQAGTPVSDLVWCDLIATADYIPLETTRESLIGEIKKSIVWKDNLIIWDNATYKLLRFGTDGKFRNLIAAPGENPGQYRSLNDFYLDTLSSTIHCLDPVINQTLIFDLNGRFVGLGTDFNPHKITPMRIYLIDNKIYTFTPPMHNKRDHFLVHKFTLDGQLENQYFGEDPVAIRNYAVENVILAQHPRWGVLFFKNFDPRIYRELENGKLETFGQLKLPHLADVSLLQDNTDYIALLEQLSASGQTSGLEFIRFTDSLAWFTYAREGKLHYNLQNLATGYTLSFSQIASSPTLCPMAKITETASNTFIGQVHIDQPWASGNPELPDPTPELEKDPEYQLIRSWVEAWKTRSVTQDNPVIGLYTFHNPGKAP